MVLSPSRLTQPSAPPSPSDPPPRSHLGRLGHLIHRHARRIVVIGIVLAGLAGVLGRPVLSQLDPPGRAEDPSSESALAKGVLERATGSNPEPAFVAVVAVEEGVGSPDARRKVAQVAGVLESDPEVVRVESVLNTRGDRGLVAADDRATVVVGHVRPGPEKAAMRAADRVKPRLDALRGVTLGGVAVANEELEDTAHRDLKRAEMLALPVVLLLSLWFFRGLVAALLPPLVGALAIVLTLVVLRVISEMTSLAFVALNLVTGLGLGLAIDFTLFMVSRYREELALHGAGPRALQRTLETAGRTIVFSALIVSSALASLLVFPQRFLYSMGVGGALVPLIAAGVAVLFLPAVLALLGPRVNALAPARLRRSAGREARPSSAGAWYRLSRVVMRRPRLVAALSAAALIAVGLPFLNAEFRPIDSSVLPAGSEARTADEVLRRDFPRLAAPVLIAAEAPPGAGPEAFAAAARDLRGLKDVTAVRVDPTGDPTVAAISLATGVPALSDRAQALVQEIRGLPSRGLDLKVGGESAAFVDQQDSLMAHLPLAVVLVVAATVAVMFAMTGSLVLPLKALVMNVLTLSAAFGFLVFVFQAGRLTGVLDYTPRGALDSTQPVLLAALVLGLSTDYGVFLLSRIKEARDGGAGDGTAVALGLERTGRIVTAAALLFCVAIGAFATSDIVFIKEIGVGTAVAVLIDAFVIRALLVPSLMALLGRRNWWAPAPLRRLHERIGLVAH